MSTSWELSGNDDFDHRKFYPDGRFGRGDNLSEPKAIRVPEQLMALISKLIEDKSVPSVDSFTDAVRDGLVRTAYTYIWHINDPEGPETKNFRALTAGMEARQLQRYRKSIDEGLDVLDEDLTTATGQYKEELVKRLRVMSETCWVDSHVQRIERMLGRYGD